MVANCDDEVGSTSADARLLVRLALLCRIMPFPIVDIRMSVLMIRDERDFKFKVVDDDDEGATGTLTFSS